MKQQIPATLRLDFLRIINRSLFAFTGLKESHRSMHVLVVDGEALRLPASRHVGHDAPKPAKARKTTTERKPSRKDAIAALISRPKGAKLFEIMTETGWLKHSVRGMISILGKTMKIASSKSDAGERTYNAQQPEAAKPKAAKPAPAAA